MSPSSISLLRKLYAATERHCEGQNVSEDLSATLEQCRRYLRSIETSPASRAPPEVLDAIVKHLRSRDVMTVTRVSVTWSNSARRKLWATIDIDKMSIQERRLINRSSAKALGDRGRLLPMSEFPIKTILRDTSGNSWKYEISKELRCTTTVTKVIYRRSTDNPIHYSTPETYPVFLESFSRLTELEMIWPLFDTRAAPRSLACRDPLAAMADKVTFLKRLTIVMYCGLSGGPYYDENGNNWDYVGFKDIRKSPLCRSVEHLTIKERAVDHNTLGPQSELRLWSDYDREILFSGILSQFGHLKSLAVGAFRERLQMQVPWMNSARAHIETFLDRMDWRKMETLSLEAYYGAESVDLAERFYQQISEQCRRLRSLSLYTFTHDFGDDAGTPGMSLLSLLTTLPSLEELHLYPTVSRWNHEREFPQKQDSLRQILLHHSSMRAFSFGVCSLFDSTSLEILTSTCPHLTSLTLDRVGRIPAADLTNTVGRLLFLEDLRIELMIGLRPVEMAHAKALVDHPRLMSLRYSEYDLAGEDVRDVLFQRFTGK